VRGEKEADKCISRRERQHRDVIMLAVQQKIYSHKIPCDRVRVGGRSLHSKYRERIMRFEFDQFSLRYTYLIADAVGIDVDVRASSEAIAA